MAYQSTNPYDTKILASFDECTASQLESKLATAAACYHGAWRATTFAQRAAVLARAATLMRERSEEFATLITLEMGKLIAQSRGEVAISAAILDYYAEHAEQFLAPATLSTRSGEATVESHPVGVLFGVAWNLEPRT